MELYIGEVCSKCGKGTMTHPRLYYYECSYCGYAYKIAPATKWNDNPIRIIRKPFKRGRPK